MCYIVVYLSSGEVIDFTDVNDRRRVWRRVSKVCKRLGTRVKRVSEFRSDNAYNIMSKIGVDVLYMDTDTIIANANARNGVYF